MTANRSLLALAFLLVLLAGSLEARPRALVLNLVMPHDSPSPANDGPFGSSILFDTLREEGFRVAVVPQASDLERLRFAGDLVLIFIIGSDYLTEEAANNVGSAIRYIASSESGAGGLAVVIADEAPSRALLGLIDDASLVLCGNSLFTISPGMPGRQSSLVVLTPEGEGIAANAGATGMITGLTPRAKGFLASSVLAATRSETFKGEIDSVEATVFAYAAPSPIDGSPVPVPAGIACRKNGNALLLLADSSVLLNGSGVSGYVGVGLAFWAFPGADPKDVIVITIQEAYIGEGREVAIGVHPSIVMVALAQALPEVERGLTASIRSVPLLAVGFLASTMLLLAALAGGGREALYSGQAGREVNRGRVARSIYAGVAGRWLETGLSLKRRLLGRTG